MSKENLDKKDSKKKNATGAKSVKKNDSNKKRNNTKNASSKRNADTKTKANKNNLEEKKEKDLKKVVIADEKDEASYDYYDEDLEEFYGEEDEEEVVEVKKEKKEGKKKEDKRKEEETKEKEEKKKEKEEKRKEKIERNNIKKIENMAKKKKKNSKKEFDFSKLDNPEIFHITLAFIIGAAIATIIAFVIWPDRIATLKNGEQAVVKVAGKTYTADNLYKRMKDHYSVSQLLDQIDNDILTKKYPETDEMKKEVESTAENYINMYKQYYNYTEEQFLSANGFSSKDDYLDYLKLDNRRKKYEEEYVKKSLSDKEIEEYYSDNVYGDIKCEHVLVEVASDNSSTSTSSKSNKLKDEDAKKLAQEIIDKINDGTSWKDIQKKYKDKVTYENLGYQSWDSDLETTFKDALKKMDNKSYSSEPVKTSYGYHVIYRESQKKTPSLKNTKDKIIEKLVDKKMKDDSNLLYKALISLRNDKKIKFSDTDMKSKYDAYIKQYNK